MSILITGAAGYIGSHTAHLFCQKGEHVVALDNLSEGNKMLVPAKADFYQGDISDEALVRDILNTYAIECVIHFAASVSVAESVQDPWKYYHNNVANTISFLKPLLQQNQIDLIFSSTAAVYGNSENSFVDENEDTFPESPYARSKLMIEGVIRDLSQTHPLNAIILRYFNVAGSDLQKRTGQVNQNATHLIKIACEVALKKRDHLFIFGNDYPTEDGTCVRDYIHVSDLAQAHYCAYQHLAQRRNQSTLDYFNCGYGKGYSVLQVIKVLEEIVGHKLPVIQAPRRKGDLSSLVANSEKLQKQMRWQPQYKDLSTIIQSALDWELHWDSKTFQ